MDDRTIKVALLIDNEDISKKVREELDGPGAGIVFEFVSELEEDQAAIFIADYHDPLKSLPVMEMIYRANGKPVVVIVPESDGEQIRKLFLQGASDVIVTMDIPKQIRFSIRQILKQQSVEDGRDLISDDLIYFRQISELAGAGGDLRTFFSRIVSVVSDFMDVEIVSLMLLNERFQTLWIAAAKGLDEEIVRSASVRVGSGISGKVAALGRPLLIQDVELEGMAAIDKSSKKYKTKGLLSVPIKVRNKVIGIINVNNKRSGFSFDESDMNLLTTLSNQAGLAIENARLFSDLQSKAQSLEQANLKLRRLNQAKTELLINLSHEFKTPLTAIIGYVDLLLGDEIKTREKSTELLKKVSARGRHLNRLAERIITYFALQTDSIEWEFEDATLTSMLLEVEKRMSHRAEEAGVKINIDTPSLGYTLRCDFVHMQEVFWNLLTNAIQFNYPGGRVDIYGETQCLDIRSVRVNIFNTSKGIPDSIAKSIFDGFVQTDKLMTDKPDGLGIGLAMSRSIIEKHGGSLELAENSAEGVTFTVILPLR